MAISKKNKRPIKYNNATYRWWVLEEMDGSGGMLSVNIASEDRKFLIKYFAFQADPDHPHLHVIGEYFPGIERNGGRLKLPCPNFTEGRDVTPKLVRAILEWSFERQQGVTELPDTRH